MIEDTIKKEEFNLKNAVAVKGEEQGKELAEAYKYNVSKEVNKA